MSKSPFTNVKSSSDLSKLTLVTDLRSQFNRASSSTDAETSRPTTSVTTRESGRSSLLTPQQKSSALFGLNPGMRWRRRTSSTWFKCTVPLWKRVLVEICAPVFVVCYYSEVRIQETPLIPLTVSSRHHAPLLASLQILKCPAIAHTFRN